MKLNELKKVIYDFNSVSNRLMQADYNDYLDVLTKFMRFIKETPIIYEYISDCGAYEQDLQQEFQEIGRSYGRSIFDLGVDSKEEVSKIYAILAYVVEKKINIQCSVAMGYSSSNKYQDIIKGFNNRVVMVLIRHIEGYLTKIGIDMGLDETVNYTITVQNGQVNIANDMSTINTVNNVLISEEKLEELMSATRNATDDLSEEEIDSLESCLEAIREEAKTEKPKKSVFRAAISSLRLLKGSAEFGAAVATLIQFIQPLL